MDINGVGSRWLTCGSRSWVHWLALMCGCGFVVGWRWVQIPVWFGVVGFTSCWEVAMDALVTMMN